MKSHNILIKQKVIKKSTLRKKSKLQEESKILDNENSRSNMISHILKKVKNVR